MDAVLPLEPPALDVEGTSDTTRTREDLGLLTASVSQGHIEG